MAAAGCRWIIKDNTINIEQRRVAKQRLFAALCKREEITARPPPGGPIAETMWMPSTYLWASIEQGLQLQHSIVLHTVLLSAACSLFMPFFMDWDSSYVPERVKTCKKNVKSRDSKECGVESGTVVLESLRCMALTFASSDRTSSRSRSTVAAILTEVVSQISLSWSFCSMLKKMM